MTHGTDFGGLLAWGLRRYAWLVALFVIALGVVVPMTLQQAPAEYEARAQVGPVRALRVPNLDVLPRMATDVFRSIPDAPEVKAAAGVSGSQPVSTDQLELVAAQDNIIFTVVARGDSPAVARDTANAAAASFVDELNVYSQTVGSFSVNRLATAPTEPAARVAGPMAWAIGIAAGLVAGLGTVVLLLLLLRPVIDVGTVARVTGVPVLGRVTSGRRGEGFSGMTQVCHRILSQPTGMVLMVGAPDTRRARREMTSELASWLSRVRRVIPLGSREPVDHYGSASLALSGYPDVLFILDDASPVEVATRPEGSLTLLVLREGISRPALEEQAQQYLDGGNGAVVLVRPRSRLSRLRWRRSRRPARPRRFRPLRTPVIPVDGASASFSADREVEPEARPIPTDLQD